MDRLAPRRHDLGQARLEPQRHRVLGIDPQRLHGESVRGAVVAALDRHARQAHHGDGVAGLGLDGLPVQAFGLVEAVHGQLALGLEEDLNHRAVRRPGASARSVARVLRLGSASTDASSRPSSRPSHAPGGRPTRASTSSPSTARSAS